MDYYKIGQRVRMLRRAQDLSQEELAERVGISVTHMSHIETGNTKLSLPVFLQLSQVLGVGTDDLLGEPPSHSSAENIPSAYQIYASILILSKPFLRKNFRLL